MNLTDAIKSYGGRKKLAQALGLKSSEAIRKWEVQGYVPWNRVREVEARIGVPAHELNPIVFDPSNQLG